MKGFGAGSPAAPFAKDNIANRGFLTVNEQEGAQPPADTSNKAPISPAMSAAGRSFMVPHLDGFHNIQECLSRLTEPTNLMGYMNSDLIDTCIQTFKPEE